MGNCQAADAAAVAVIQHPDGRVETSSCPLSASDIMAANSGHYVAVIVTVTHPRSSSSAAHYRSSSSSRSGGGDGKQVRYLKLLRPDDTLLVGQFYRLVSFEDVLREFGSKRRVRLSKLLAKKEEELRKHCEEANPSSTVVEEDEETLVSEDSRSSVRVARKGQWRPALQTIAEVDSFK
ncbi:hypothetical protein OPV22_033500 [Ensete ventricosum]|uniref:Uncharacterized protein n=1 Tax=Ensete ventricosum TaxID=4639 RepID=A0AAV8Q275_ENSVE|nr:hypothetical protein OPV22_033500 [Ensete ventricosum]